MRTVYTLTSEASDFQVSIYYGHVCLNCDYVQVTLWEKDENSHLYQLNYAKILFSSWYQKHF